MPDDVTQEGKPTPESPPLSSAAQFAKMAEDRQPGFFSEFWNFLRQNKKWWLTPIFIILLLLIALVIVSQTPLAPFIYPFF
ncbi:MAG: drug/metabolite transporter superfamily protein YnfA [Verrucomicrobiales bacterium]|jgi:drug/metabolite transporter superfamily protein YnfA